MQSLTNTVKTAATAYISFQAASKAAEVTIGAMTETSASLESYRATLNVVMKDQVKAAQTMEWAARFANQTPFETDGVVEATVRLESYSLAAKKYLPQIGDMAAVMGKDLMQGVEAVADAQNGELERLKEFGITKAKIIEHAEKRLGYIDLVNKQGQITNQEKFNDALFSLMEDSFSGGMKTQAGLYNGLMSTISGVWKSGLASMAGVSLSGEVVDGSLFSMIKVNAESLAKFLTDMSENGTFERMGEKIADFAKFIGYGIDLASAGMKKVWPYIKKTGVILESLVSNSVASLSDFKPILAYIGKQADWVKKAFMTGFNKTRMVIDKNLPSLLKFKDNVIDLAKKVKSGLVGAFEMAKPPVQWIIENGMPLVASGIAGVIEFANDLYSKFTEHWPSIQPVIENIGNALKDGLVSAFEIAKPIVEYLINDGFPLMTEILGTVVDIGMDVFNVFVDNWSLIEPIIVGISGALAIYKVAMIASNVVTAISTGLTTAYIVSLYALEAAIAVLTSPVTLVIAAIAALIAIGYLVVKNWDEITAWLGEKFDAIAEWGAGVGEKISDGFTAAYENVVQTWEGIKDWFGGLWEGIVDVGKGYVNIYVKILNWLIDGLNKVSFEVPDWVPEIGGKSVGVNIPKIPLLAEGGITTGPTLAMIGEGKEQEAVLPLSKLSTLLQIAILKSKRVEEKPQGKPRSFKEMISSFSTSIVNVKEESVNHFEYKPTYIIEGNASKKDIIEVDKKARDDFDAKYNKMKRKVERLAFE